MPLVNMKKILTPAFAQRYAVGSFNVSDFILLEAILDAASRFKSPVILSLAEVHLQFIDMERAAFFSEKLAADLAVPVVLHLDHGLKYETIIKAIQCGFTSVMFDGSKLEYEENIKQTAEIVKICRAVNVSVEAELGGIGGDEGGGLFAEADESLFTDPEMAADFVNRTGIDALAVAIGNVHGNYQGDPRLDFERLEKIEERTQIPLVLHGGSGISEPDFKRAISLGISKINFYTGMASAALEEIRRNISSAGIKYNDYPELILNLRKRISEIVGNQIKIFGSNNKINE